MGTMTWRTPLRRGFLSTRIEWSVMNWKKIVKLFKEVDPAVVVLKTVKRNVPIAPKRTFQ